MLADNMADSAVEVVNLSSRKATGSPVPSVISAPKLRAKRAAGPSLPDNPRGKPITISVMSNSEINSDIRSTAAGRDMTSRGWAVIRRESEMANPTRCEP